MLAAEQIMVLGLAATALTFVLRILASYANLNLGRIAVNVLLSVVSGGFAVLWSDIALPPFSGNPVEWVSALLQLLTPIVGMASLIYNVLYDKVILPLTYKFSR